MDKDLAIAIAAGFLLAAAISVIAYIFLRKKLVAERKNIRGEADRGVRGDMPPEKADGSRIRHGCFDHD